MAGKRHRKKRGTRQGKAQSKPPQQKSAPPVFPKLYDSSDEFSTHEDDKDYDFTDMFEDLMHATTYDRRSGRHSPIINRGMVEIMLEEDPEMYGTDVTLSFANYARQSLDDMGRWSRPGEAGTSKNSSAGYANKKPAMGETSKKPHAAEPDKKLSMGETSK
uniref:Uncharacterized protein n=1 Tax=Anopheles dirus TaxID=7168 RepID=A0A182NVT0_9DIPT